MKQKHLTLIKLAAIAVIIASMALVAAISLNLAQLANAAPSQQSRTVQRAIFNYDPVTISLTGTQSITPATQNSSHLLLSPSGAVLTLTLNITGSKTGDVVLLVGASSVSNTTLVDTGATGGGGNRTIGPTDVWFGLFNGTAWVETNFVDNS